MLQQRRPSRDLAEDERGGIERRQPRVGDDGAREQRDERAEHQRRLADGDEHERDRQRERRRPPRTGEQPDGERRQERVARMVGERVWRTGAMREKSAATGPSHRHERRQRGEPLRADAGHLPQLLDAREAAVLPRR